MTVTKEPTVVSLNVAASRRMGTPWWVDTILLAASVMSAEILVMFILPDGLNPWFENILDGSLLTTLIAPLLAWTLYRRQQEHTSQHRAQLNSGSPHLRVRWAMISAFAVITMLTLIGGWQDTQAAERSHGQSKMINLAGRQRMLSQRLARFAALSLSSDPAARAAALTKLEATAEQMLSDGALVSQRAKGYQAADPHAFAPAAAAITAAEKERADLLAAVSQLPAALSRSDAAGSALALESSIQAHADSFLECMEAAVSELQHFAEHSSTTIFDDQRAVLVLTLVVIVLLMALIIEPTIQILRRQHATMMARSDEFERLAMVAQRTTNAVVLTDQNGRIRWVNEGYTRIAGYTLDEALGHIPGHLVQFDGTNKETVQQIRNAIRTAQPYNGEILNRAKSGREYWVKMDIQPLFDKDNKLAGFMSIQSDITAQKMMEEQTCEAAMMLAAANQTLEEAQSVGRVGSWSIDIVAGNVDWSRQVYRLLGRNEDLGPPTYTESMAAFTGTSAAQLQEAILHCSRDATPFSLVLSTAARVADVRHVRVEGRARRNATGNPVAVFGTIMDVTSQIETESALQIAREQAEAASLSKSEFLANMSHEIRTPMSAILGYADLLAEEGDRGAAPKHRLEYIETIKRNGDHLLMIINDILDLSKIEAGKMTVESIGVSPVAIVADLLSLMRVKTTAKGLTLRAVYDSPIPKTITTDPIRLRQILVNLVGNAVKFTEIGGVTVHVDFIADPVPSMRFSVVDTGIGMTPAQCEKLFSAFSQADTSITRKYGGTGLGLRISQRLANILGGTIAVTSTPGKGSTFTVTIATGPVDPTSMDRPIDSDHTVRAPINEPIPSGVQRLDGKRILLAEDGVDNQRLIAFHLRKAGASVTIVENGKLAVEALTIDATTEGLLRFPPPFDLIITDMQMPVLDGYTATRVLRGKGCDLPIIALTANAMTGDADKCLNAGCDAFCTKPIERAKLIEAVANTKHTRRQTQNASTPPDVASPVA